MIIKLARKCVYLELFLLGMSAMGYWNQPQTLPILMGTYLLAATFLRFIEVDGESERRLGADMVDNRK